MSVNDYIGGTTTLAEKKERKRDVHGDAVLDKS